MPQHGFETVVAVVQKRFREWIGSRYGDARQKGGDSTLGLR
jgi:hypothetical protein